MANLSVTITESVNLNGNEMGSNNVYSAEGILNATQIVKTCPVNSETYIGNYNAAVNTANYASFDFDNAKYVRLTNLSTTEWIEIAYVTNDGEVADSCRFMLLPGQSSLMWDAKAGKLGERNPPVWGTACSTLSYIAIYNRGEEETVDVECFVASA